MKLHWPENRASASAAEIPPVGERDASWIVNDGPDDLCFGCGHSNSRGLKLAVRKLEAGGVEAIYRVVDEFAGARGVVHGGIQAALMDEITGFAVHAAVGEDGAHFVTAKLEIEYLKPALTGVALRLLGQLERQDGRDYFASGEIWNERGELVTRASARWRRLRRD
jgi:uncharacterized protein (TIGR00369 family)